MDERYARAAKDFPLAHALFALATFVAACDKVLAETPDTKLDFARQFDIGAGRKLFLECRGAAPAVQGAARRAVYIQNMAFLPGRANERDYARGLPIKRPRAPGR
jgi:hypothetical protein